MAVLWPPPFSAAVGRVVLVLTASIAHLAPAVDAVLVRSSASGYASQRVTPVEQVIKLLKGLSAKVKEEGTKEAAQYDKFACYCKEQADEKLYAVQKAEAAIKKLNATITKLDGEMDALNLEIRSTSDSIKAATEAIQNATELRGDQQDEYTEESDRIDSCIAALEAAIQAMTSSKAAMTGDVRLDLPALASSILHAADSSEQSGGLVSLAQRASLKALAKGKQPAYEYSSNGILDTLQDLLKKFKAQKHDVDEAERIAQQAYDLKVQGLSNEVKFAKDAKLENERSLASKAEARSAADEERGEEGKVKQASQTFLQDLQNECESKAEQWDTRSKARSEELQVLGQAIEAIETGVAPNWQANKKLVDLQRTAKRGSERRLPSAPSAFLQLKTYAKTESRKDSKGSQQEGSGSAKMIQTKVLTTLASAAAHLRSPALSMLVMRVQASDDHFVKVRGLIKDLLRRLSDDKSDEADQKQYCDTQMNQAITSRDTNAQTVETKVGEIAVKTSTIEKLNGEISQLHKDVAASKKALGEAAELRSEESTNNQRTLKEAEEGKKAVEFAITVLSDFYGVESTSLVQVGSQVSQAPYSRKATDAIFGLLHVILSDFDRTLSTVSSDEDSAGEDYDDMRQKTEADIEADEGAIEDKQDEITTLASEITDLKEEKKSAEENMEAAVKELEALKKQCVEGEGWDERSSARKKEVEALKEALEILDQWQG